MDVILSILIPFAVVTVVLLYWALKTPYKIRGDKSYRSYGQTNTEKQIDELHKQQTYKFWRDLDK